MIKVILKLKENLNFVFSSRKKPRVVNVSDAKIC